MTIDSLTASEWPTLVVKNWRESALRATTRARHPSDRMTRSSIEPGQHEPDSGIRRSPDASTAPRPLAKAGYRADRCRILHASAPPQLAGNPIKGVLHAANPLHPAVVHFPVVLAFLLPLFALGALWTIRRGTTPRRAWAVPVALSAALALSAWVAVQTGVAQEERVEKIVSGQPLDAHEDAAELFLTLSGALLLITAAGLVGGVVGRSARVLATGGATALVIMAINVGHSGGELVYRYGAASAYIEARTPNAVKPASGEGAIATAALVADKRSRPR